MDSSSENDSFKLKIENKAIFTLLDIAKQIGSNNRCICVCRFGEEGEMDDCYIQMNISVKDFCKKVIEKSSEIQEGNIKENEDSIIIKLTVMGNKILENYYFSIYQLSSKEKKYIIKKLEKIIDEKKICINI